MGILDRVIKLIRETDPEVMEVYMRYLRKKTRGGEVRLEGDILIFQGGNPYDIAAELIRIASF